MKYKKAKNLSDKDFKRFYGVRQETFLLMCQEGVLGTKQLNLTLKYLMQ